MQDIWLIRDGRTAGNHRRAYIGRTDEPLAGDARTHLARLAATAPTVEAVYTSPLIRCTQSAALLYPALPPTLCDDLREYDFGCFEGKTYDQLKDDPAYRLWLDAYGQASAPGGEDIARFKARCARGFAAIVADLCARCLQSAAVITHGGVIMAILERYAPQHTAFGDWHIQNGQAVHTRLDEALWRERQQLALAQKIAWGSQIPR